MSRINPVNPEETQGKAKELLDKVKAKMGRQPNLLKTMVHSPSVLEAYLGFSGALQGASLPARLREQIALTVAEDNGCDYCVAAHSAIGKAAGLSETEIEAARQANAADAREKAAIQFAKALSGNRGNVTDKELEAVRKAGYSDGQILEIVAVVSFNLFTNYVNHVAGTEIDFPKAKPLALAGVKV